MTPKGMAPIDYRNQPARYSAREISARSWGSRAREPPSRLHAAMQCDPNRPEVTPSAPSRGCQAFCFGFVTQLSLNFRSKAHQAPQGKFGHEAFEPPENAPQFLQATLQRTSPRQTAATGPASKRASTSKDRSCRKNVPPPTSDPTRPASNLGPKGAEDGVNAPGTSNQL